MFHLWRETTSREGARSSGTVVDASQEVLYARISPGTEPFEYKRTTRFMFPDGSTRGITPTSCWTYRRWLRKSSPNS
jgi:hypothetical protein